MATLSGAERNKLPDNVVVRAVLAQRSVASAVNRRVEWKEAAL